MTLLNYNKQPREYKYYVDYNEIVERMEHLIASQSAGNISHHKEIVSIIEELEEAGSIK